ncbi:MAG: hypothetical protein ACRDRS_04310 [Pseudonocardiaceae bacterium]
MYEADGHGPGSKPHDAARDSDGLRCGDGTEYGGPVSFGIGATPGPDAVPTRRELVAAVGGTELAAGGDRGEAR